MLFLLCNEGLSKAVIKEYYEHVKSVNKFVICAILQVEESLNLIRRELKRVSPGIKIVRFPYIRAAYLLSTGGREFDR
jgi:hypothetical protein